MVRRLAVGLVASLVCAASVVAGVGDVEAEGAATRPSPDAVITTLAGGPPAGDARRISFDTQRFAIAENGDIYLQNSIHHTLHRYERASGQLSVIAGNGELPDGSAFVEDGPPLQMALDPCAVAVEGERVWFLDSKRSGFNEQAIRYLDSDGVVHTYARGGISRDDGVDVSEAIIDSCDFTLAPNGDIYFISSFERRVRRIDRGTRVVTTVAGGGFGNAEDGMPATSGNLSGAASPAIAPNGDVYFVERSSESCRIRRIDGMGLLHTVAGTATCSPSTADGALALGASLDTYAVVLDASGRPVFSEFRRVRVINDDGTLGTLVGNGANTYQPYGDGGPAIDAGVSMVRGFALDDAGLVFSDLWRMRAVGADGIVSTIVGNGFPRWGGDGGPAPDAQSSEPAALAVSPDGSMVFGEMQNRTVRRITPDGVISTIAGNGAGYPLTVGGPAVEVALQPPGAVAVDPTDNSVVIGEQGYDDPRLLRVTPAGTLELLARDLGYGITAVAVSPAGGIYAVLSSHAVMRLGADGTWEPYAGTGEYGHSGDGGPASEARIGYIRALVFDRAGNLLIGQFGYIRRVTPDGIIQTIAGNGTSTYDGDGSVATETGIGWPAGVGVDAHSGAIYFTEPTDERVRMISGGRIYTVAGRGPRNWGSYTGDGGAALNALLDSPWGVGVDATGAVVFADRGNDRIRRLTWLTPPSASAPAISTDASIWPLVDVRWGVGDRPGFTYDVQLGNQVIDNGAWAVQWRDWFTDTTVTSARLGSTSGPAAVPGTTYYVRVRARTPLEVSSWSSPIRTAVPRDDRWSALVYRGNWFNRSGLTRYKRTLRMTGQRGASVAVTSNASGFVVIGDRCPRCGNFKLYIDGHPIATVDTFSASRAVRQHLVERTLPGGVGRHTVRLVALGTPGRPELWLDGIAVVT